MLGNSSLICLPYAFVVRRHGVSPSIPAFSRIPHPRDRVRSTFLLALLFASFTLVGAALAGEEAEGRWPFHPPRDTFSADALLDLRGLNESVAGEHGFVVRAKDGSGFTLGDGQPLRLWAVNDNAFDKNLPRHARFLAKRGINMVRFHLNTTPTTGKLGDIDESERDRLWKGIAAMKKEGIYVTYSPYWAGPARVNPSMGILDTEGGGNWGLLFFDPKLQEAYRQWLRRVLTEANPYTGLPLSKDPALAIIELQNEDSLLFWTSQGIKGEAKKELRRQFGHFLAEKYGSLNLASKAWGGAAPSPDQDGADDFAREEAAMYIAWELTQHRGGAGHERRCADQMEFLATTMRRFNQMAGEFLKRDLGCRQLVNAGNWRTADNVTMLDAERWSYGANEVMAVNRYYNGAHEGANAGWAIVNGDRFTDDSALLHPREFPLALKQVRGYPMIVTESSWVPPLGYQSEGPFLVAAYQSLTGVAGYYWFATGEEDWRQPGSANGFMPSEGKWICATPMLMGQWPAAALAYRRGYISQGKPVVREHRSLDDLWHRRKPLIAEDPGYDPNRDSGGKTGAGNPAQGVDPLAYLAGPVLVDYGVQDRKNVIEDLGAFLDKQSKTVRSVTGELRWDYGRGVCVLNSPKAQGAAGFLKPYGVLDLADVQILSGNEYATVMLVAMDDKPLGDSTKILVQVGTKERPDGWKTKPVQIAGRPGEEVVSYGRAPWMIVRADLTLYVKNSKFSRARALDVNGMPVADIPLEGRPNGMSFRFPPDALYVVLEGTP